jgi:hypothetical protein
MDSHKPFHARSGDVLIEGDLAVLSFLTAIDGEPNVSVAMDLRVLERLQSRIERALAELPEQSSPK